MTNDQIKVSVQEQTRAAINRKILEKSDQLDKRVQEFYRTPEVLTLLGQIAALNDALKFPFADLVVNIIGGIQKTYNVTIDPVKKTASIVEETE